MSRSRHRDYSRLFIALGLLAGLMAIAPIVGAVIGLGSTAATPRTAFASAPSGEYAVLTRSDGSAEVIAVAWAENLGAITEVARVPRVEGFASTGSVSPDGKFVALTTVEGGSLANPVASIVVVNLETGLLVRAALGAQYGQPPVWSPDGRTIAFARPVDSGGALSVGRVDRDGKGETTVREFRSVLGVYPVGYDSAGRLAVVTVNGRGSWLHRDGAEALSLSGNLTRDWEMSPDGSAIAFIDVSTAGGVDYAARTVSLGGAGAVVEALSAGVPALGAAWNPATSEASFGFDPGASAGVTVQALSASGADLDGFDVPLAYSASGEALAVTHWSGSSFEESGTPELQVITPAGRATYDGYTRFLGWSAR